MSELNKNSLEPDQIPCSVASDLGLHCLPVSLLWDAGHKWVKCLNKVNKPCHLQRMSLTLICEDRCLSKLCRPRSKFLSFS